MSPSGRAAKTAALSQRVTGAFVGLATGDALGRMLAGLSPAEVRSSEPAAERKRSLLHGAVTTWALCVLDALLYRHGDEPLAGDLAVRLRVLVSPCRGEALRSLPRSLGGTLRQVAAALDKGVDGRLCGIDDVTAEGIMGALPLAFALGDEDEDVARALTAVIGLTHRHARVTTSAGLWLGGLRTLLRRPTASKSDVLAAGGAFARLTLDVVRADRAGALVGAGSEAEGALALALAAADGAEDPRDLLAPAGYDGRDAPERLAAAALIGASLAAGALVEVANGRLAQGGDVDVTLPLLLATFGAAHGGDHLPLVLVDRLATAAFVRERSEALYGERPPRLAPLVLEELRLSRRNSSEAALRAAPAAAPSVDERAREQLKLL